MSLQSIEQTFAAAAKAEWAKIEAEGIVIEQELVADVETTFAALSAQFAPLVMSTISNLATAEFASLSGSEKGNLATTTIVDKAAQSGVTILAEDATALVKNGFEAFQAAAPALVPAPLEAAADGALDTAEAAVEGAVDTAAEKADALVEPAPEPVKADQPV